MGLKYYPAIERKFREPPSEAASLGGKKAGDSVACSGSGPDGRCHTLKSTCRGALYLQEVPEAWKSALQSFSAYSANAAEFRAPCNLIRMVQQYGLRGCLPGSKEAPALFCANIPALPLAGTPLPKKKAGRFSVTSSVAKNFCESITYIPTQENRTDGLIKEAPGRKPRQIFQSCKKAAGNLGWEEVGAGFVSCYLGGCLLLPKSSDFRF